MGLPVSVIPIELPSYQRKENFGSDETFFQIVKKLTKKIEKTEKVSCNILGPTALGFRHRDDVTELITILSNLGVSINVVAPLNATVSDITNIGAAHFNVLLYPENGEAACRWLEKEFGQKYTKVVPIGVGATKDFIKEVSDIIGIESPPVDMSRLRFDWWSRSVDSTYFTGKRVFIFGDGTHVKSSARIARDEMGFEVVGMGCFNREFARDIRNLAKEYGVEALITDDYLEVEKQIATLQPEMILGTQMERHIGKRLGIPCAVISAPFHVQDNPARYSPQVGWEGANVIFDTWVHPLVMGLEEHLLHMFRDDFEFNDSAGPSHHGSHNISKGKENTKNNLSESADKKVSIDVDSIMETVWLGDAEKELKKIPFFVRGKARRNTETYALSQGLKEISVETLYEAKAHYAN
jgi:light-independent protochlorophyllide reductase subunit B